MDSRELDTSGDLEREDMGTSRHVNTIASQNFNTIASQNFNKDISGRGYVMTGEKIHPRNSEQSENSGSETGQP